MMSRTRFLVTNAGTDAHFHKRQRANGPGVLTSPTTDESTGELRSTFIMFDVHGASVAEPLASILTWSRRTKCNRPNTIVRLDFGQNIDELRARPSACCGNGALAWILSES